MKKLNVIWILPIIVLFYIMSIIYFICKMPSLIITSILCGKRYSKGFTISMGKHKFTEFMNSLNIKFPTNIKINVVYEQVGSTIASTNSKGDMTIILPTLMYNSNYEIKDTIRHELVHRDQILRGDLIIDPDKETITWKGDKKTLFEWGRRDDKINFKDAFSHYIYSYFSPWEMEAYAYTKIKFVLTISHIFIVMLIDNSIDILKDKLKKSFS